MPSGTFFAAGPGSDLDITATSVLKDGPGQIEVVATVQNSGAGAIRFGAAADQTFQLLAADGSVVGSGLLSPLETYANAGQKTYLGGWVSGLSAADLTRVDRASANVTFQQAATQPASIFDIKSPMAQADASGANMIVRGRISNGGSERYGSGSVCVVLLDSDMKPAAWLTDDQTLASLSPGQDAIFDAAVPALPVALLDSIFVSVAGLCGTDG
jgi:hypothetical protein